MLFRSGFVAALPDITTSDALLWPISRDPDFRLVRVCKEDEGVAICTGLAFAGRRSVLLMQQTGLLDSINAIRAVAVEYEQPVVMLVGLQGKEPGIEPAASSKFAVNIVPPILDAICLPHLWLESSGDEENIAPAIEVLISVNAGRRFGPIVRPVSSRSTIREVPGRADARGRPRCFRRTR